MAKAIYLKYNAIDRGPYVLDWGFYKQAPSQGYLCYTGYNFNSTTGQFTLTGGTFFDTTQEQRYGYRLDGSTPVRVYTYNDTTMEDGMILINTGTIAYLPNRDDRYYKGDLLGTVELEYGSVPDDGVQDGYWYVFQRMATPLWARVGGVWYPGSSLSGRVGGVWKNETKLSVRVGGVWH